MPTTGFLGMASPTSLTLPRKIVAALYRKDFKALKRFLNKDTIKLGDEDDGRTLLMLACGVEDGLELVRFLIEQGADVNLADTGGCTALHFAVIDFRKEVSRLLLECGADPNAQDDSGWTPLHHLIRGPNFKVLLAMDLLRYGADPHQDDAAHESPRDAAEREGEDDLLALLSKQKTSRKKRRPKT
jgi:ankyrin repeat protein